MHDRIVVGVRDAKLSEKQKLDHDLTINKAVKQVRHHSQSSDNSHSSEKRMEVSQSH